MKLPRKGEIVEIAGPQGEVAILKKCSSGRDWNLKKVGVDCHSRFGNSAEIREDIEHFRITGRLPMGEHW